MATVTVKESGGDYTSLNSALNNVNAGDTISIEGTFSSADTTACSTADDNLTITTDADAKTTPARHAAASPDHYRLEVGSGPHAFTLNNAGLSMTGVEIYQHGGSSDECIRISSCNGTLDLTDCILYTSHDASDMDCVYWNNGTEASHVATFTNCLIYNAERSPLHVYSCNGGIEINVIACTIYDYGDTGESSSAGINFRCSTSVPANSLNVFNSIIGGQVHASNDDIEVPYTGNNVSVDRCIFGTAAGSDHFDYDNNNLKSRSFYDTDQGTGDYVIFEDITGSAPYDLRLKDLGNTKNNAQDAHADSSMDDEVGGQTISMPSTDAAGTTRPQDTDYDIGAFEIESSSGTTVDCTTGAVAITGLQADISAGTTIDCTAGALAITGLQGSVSAGTTIACSAGALAITGLQAGISAGTTISATAGALTLAGLQAEIDAGAGTTIDCTAGAITIAGLTAQISAAKTIDCTTGALDISGLQAQIGQGTTIDCGNAGAVALSALAAEVIQSVVVECTTGAVIIVANRATVVGAQTAVGRVTATLTARQPRATLTARKPSITLTAR